jgi:hypothetical protein
MTARTRYFVIASLLTLGVGLGAGLVAYSTGFSTSALSRQGGSDELQFIPANAGLVAYVDVHDIMTSDLRQRLRSVLSGHANGRQEFQSRTGINIETDIDHVLVGVVPGSGPSGDHTGRTVVVARGRFDQVKIEQLMRDHGAQPEDYKSTRLVNGETRDGNASISVAFLEPGLIAVGSAPLVRSTVDLKSGGSSVSTNNDLMRLVRDIDSGNAWAVGRFDLLTSQARFPNGVADQIPAVSYFSASAHIDSGIRGTIRAEARDDAAGDSLRDVIRGFVSLAKMQTGGRPDIASALQSLQLGGTGKTVTVSFDLPATTIDSFGGVKPPAPGTTPPQ